MTGGTPRDGMRQACDYPCDYVGRLAAAILTLAVEAGRARGWE